MRNPLSVAVELSLHVVFIRETQFDFPITDADQREVSRLLLNRLAVLEAAMRAVNDLRNSAALAPTAHRNEDDNQTF